MMKLATRTWAAATIPIAVTLGERGELGPLIGGEAPTHAQKHHGAGLVQLGARSLDDVGLSHHRIVVAAFHRAVERLLRRVERLHALPQRRLVLLEDLLETRALLRRESEFLDEPVVLPP